MYYSLIGTAVPELYMFEVCTKFGDSHHDDVIDLPRPGQIYDVREIHVYFVGVDWEISVFWLSIAPKKSDLCQTSVWATWHTTGIRVGKKPAV